MKKTKMINENSKKRLYIKINITNETKNEEKTESTATMHNYKTI